MAPQQVSIRSLGRATLSRQLLLDRAELPVPEAIARIGGLQAQEAKPPHVALWNRLRDFRPEVLNAAAFERSVVRATLMRGTLHTVATVDFGHARTALTPLLVQASATIAPLPTAVTAEALAAAAREILAGGPLTFADMRPLLVQRFPSASDRALGFAVRMLVPLVLAPSDDRWGYPSVSRFGLADSWLGPAVAVPTMDEAREALVLRHLAAFGPSTAADITAWSGLRGLPPVLEGLSDRLVQLQDESGRRLFDLPDALRPEADTPAPARLLGEWDSVLLAHAERSRIVDSEVRARLMTSNGRLRNAFLVDGRVVGGWGVERSKSSATLVLEPYVQVPRRGLADAAEEAGRLLRWLEPDVADVDVRVVAAPRRKR